MFVDESLDDFMDSLPFVILHRIQFLLIFPQNPYGREVARFVVRRHRGGNGLALFITNANIITINLILLDSIIIEHEKEA